MFKTEDFLLLLVGILFGMAIGLMLAEYTIDPYIKSIYNN